MTLEELLKHMSFTDDKVIFDKSFYQEVMLPCFSNSITYKNIVKELQKENQQLKAQYCERTDCSGRIGNSKKIEQLETEKEQLNNLVNSCQKEIRRLKKELQALKVSEEEWLERVISNE